MNRLTRKKYVRTKEGKIIDITNWEFLNGTFYKRNDIDYVDEDEIVKQADTIEDLCDDFVLVAPYRFRKPKTATQLEKDLEEMKFFYTDEDDKVYGAIWTEGKHGEPILKAVTKPMNKEGEFELL